MKHSRIALEEETFTHINSFIQRLVASVEKTRKQEEAPYIHIEDPDLWDEASWK
jgi:hypothetical protein